MPNSPHLSSPSKQKIICVIGDVMLDRFVYGDVERISPEAPTPVLAYQEEKIMLGGAANVAANAVALGATVQLVGVLGADTEAKEFLQLLTKSGIRKDGLITDSGRPTTVKTRFVAKDQHLLRVDRESVEPLSSKMRNHLRTRLTRALAHADIVVCADYNKGVFDAEIITWLIAETKRLHIPLLVDAKPKTISLYKDAWLVTPNRSEVLAATGLKDAHEAAEVLRKKLKSSVLLTEGADGMTLFQNTSEPIHFPAEARGVVDVSGAGDTVVAAIAVLCAGGASLRESVEVANRAAGIVVKKWGTATVSVDELISGAPVGIANTEKKVVSLIELKKKIGDFKKRPVRVVFTNGVFDILHEGHIALLERAKSEGDVLVVGVNTDASVKRLKGPTRPVFPLAKRMRMLAALSSVDYVVSFAEDTPLHLVEQLLPNVLVKGGDYAPENVVGADMVKKIGGSLLIVPLLPGHSSTSILARLLNK